jgi:hypothetical protein
VRLNARRGSEQYRATNSRIAWSYVRCPLADVRLFSTAVLACSRSGRARTRLGDFFLRDFGFGIGDGLLYRHRQLQPIPIPAAFSLSIQRARDARDSDRGRESGDMLDSAS